MVTDDWYRRRSPQIAAATLLGEMRAEIAIVNGRRVVWYPELAIPDVLDAGEDAPSGPSDWWKLFATRVER